MSGVAAAEFYRRVTRVEVRDERTFTFHVDKLSFEFASIGGFQLLPEHLERPAFADPEKYRTFADVTGAGTNILLRSARPMTGRYVVVWFTRLPWIDGGYRGGVRSIVVRSG